MNDGRLPSLCTMKTREVCDLLCAKQSDRAICRSRDPRLCRNPAATLSERRRFPDDT